MSGEAIFSAIGTARSGRQRRFVRCCREFHPRQWDAIAVKEIVHRDLREPAITLAKRGFDDAARSRRSGQKSVATDDGTSRMVSCPRR